jgi:purine-nucleoside phosphorylase
VVAQQGRCHIYEGYTPAEVCCGVRVMRGLGAETLIITNAAGALEPRWDVGDLMLITDHINWTGQSPLTGPNHDAWGPRFPDMSAPYDRGLQGIALAAASRLRIRLERGVYLALPGPQMETPAETRMYRGLGAHAVGMSTALEVIAARHMNMRVLGISCLTNKNLPDCMAEAPLEEVIRVAGASGEALTMLVKEVLKDLR